MEYNKKKINNLIEFKDKIKDDNVKENIEWLICQYNEYFASRNEIENQRKFNIQTLKKYYDLEDEKLKLKDYIERLKRKCEILNKEYNEISTLYKACCKKNKNMV